jgi:peptidoglycan/LPS O-acetylase OafA/YrhL
MSSSSPDQNSGRIPTLDGWRGIAIVLVIVTHAQNGLDLKLVPYHPWLNLGRHGVGIFFVLSGYLITSRLLKEEKIDLREFYVRRFFRLMPVAWIYLLFLVLIRLISGVPCVGIDALACLLFFRNFYPPTETSQNAFTSHFWSLSIEEQFYLVWPATLHFVGRKWALRIAIAACAIGATYRFLHWQTYNQLFVDTHTQVNFDGLLAGCVLALLVQRDRFRIILGRTAPAVVPVGLFSMAWHIAHYHELIPLSESITIALLIGATSQTPQAAVSRLLDTKFLSQLGIYSYSLYMWQEFFLLPHIGLIFQAFLPIVAVISWHWIEQPCIRMGRRILHQKRSVPAVLVDSARSASLH